jgi:uncharacterized protein YggT (Ycf19 family)
MKDPVISLFTLVLEFYFYVLLARVILTYTTETIQNHPISLFIRKITDPVIALLHRAIPPQPVGGTYIDVALVLLLLLYHYLIDIVTHILTSLLP